MKKKVDKINCGAAVSAIFVDFMVNDTIDIFALWSSPDCMDTQLGYHMFPIHTKIPKLFCGMTTPSLSLFTLFHNAVDSFSLKSWCKTPAVRNTQGGPQVA